MKPKPDKPTKEQIEKMEVLAAKKPGLMEYAHHVGSFSIEKLNLEEMKNTSLQAMHEQSEMQLDQIYEQVELLAKQAKKIKDRSEISRRIYQAKIGFKPAIGHTYYLYERESGEEMLSIIAPNEWGKEHSYEFVAQVRLLADYTWKVENINSSKKNDNN
ncbi:MAG: DUF2452 domain-containing protein [Oligoflexales bacterium]